ncbi:MAG: hypothetical protein O2782_04905 [bacterium]|nr:hypothetical protein [bacterium]
MPQIDLQKLALRLKVVELLRLYVEHQQGVQPSAWWRRFVCPN